jgi:WD40 repeat protein
MNVNALDEELENVYVTFLSLCYLNDTLVSAGDDGHLYLWEHGRIIRRIFAHEGAIFALDANQKIGFIASGGLEGIVIIWRLLIEPRSNVKSLDKLKVYNVRKNLDAQ